MAEYRIDLLTPDGEPRSMVVEINKPEAVARQWALDLVPDDATLVTLARVDPHADD